MKVSFFDLQNNEAATSAGLIGSGLTLLRKMDFTKESYQSQAFFSLSIGLERMMKLLLIYHYRIKHNNQFPTNTILKKEFGHNLEKLFEKCNLIAKEYNINNILQQDPILDSILCILTKFSNQSRYYNLNYLSGIDEGEDCLLLWDQEVNMEILKRHCDVLDDYSEEDEKIVINPNDSIEMRLQNATIINFKNLYRKGTYLTEKAIFSVYYTYMIVNYLAKILYKVSSSLTPFIYEHYRLFLNTDIEFIIHRSEWNPYDLH